MCAPIRGLAVALFISSGPALAQGPCKQDSQRESGELFDGIVLHEESCADPLYHAWIVEMDLDEPGYRLLVTPYEERLSTTSEFAAAFDALVAVNGGFWGSSWGGLTVSDGTTWPKDPADDTVTTVVGFGRRTAKGRLKVDIRPAEEILAKPLSWMRDALFSNAVLLDKGEVVENELEGMPFRKNNPRTAVGLTKDRSTLLIAVVDGRQEDWSEGLKLPPLARLLSSHGAWRAANLDGGSSTTLVVPSLGGLVNRPSCKKAPERKVWNHLGIIRVEQEPSHGPLARILDPLRKLTGLFLGA